MTNIAIGSKVVWRGAVFVVAELGERFSEQWLRIYPATNEGLSRWVPAKLVRTILKS